MVATSSGKAVIDGERWIACTKAASLGCNWLVPEEQEFKGQRGRCLADSLVRREPDADDTIALEKLASTATALRRLIYQLIDIMTTPRSSGCCMTGSGCRCSSTGGERSNVTGKRKAYPVGMHG
jgi:hypothetical protein